MICRIVSAGRCRPNSAPAPETTALAQGAAVQQIPVFILAILAANTNVAMPSQAIVFALFVSTEALIKIAHGLPPVRRLTLPWQTQYEPNRKSIKWRHYPKNAVIIFYRFPAGWVKWVVFQGLLQNEQRFGMELG